MKTLIPAIAIILLAIVGITNVNNKKDIVIMNEKYYKGTMLGGYNFEMTLKKNGGNLSGSVLNTYHNITLVKGLMDDSNNFMLREYEHEQITGIYKGTISSEGEIKGIWSNPDGTRKLPFNMIQEVKTPPSQKDGFSVSSFNFKKLIPLFKGEES
jgi:hypothetical protein